MSFDTREFTIEFQSPLSSIPDRREGGIKRHAVFYNSKLQLIFYNDNSIVLIIVIKS